MIDFRDDGTTTIEFPPPTGTVTVVPPRWGAYKRIRAEREKIADAANVRLQELPDLPPMPEQDDQSDAAKAERVRLTPIYRAHVQIVEEITADTLFRTWKFILCGDESFQGLAAPRPPDDIDDWPLDLIVDAGEFFVGLNGQRIRTNPALIDQFFQHLGKARFSSPTAV